MAGWQVPTIPVINILSPRPPEALLHYYLLSRYGNTTSFNIC